MQAQDLARRIGDRTLFAGASLQVRAADRIGLVGPNGAGKSTLLRILCGDDQPDAGDVAIARQVRVRMLRQEIDPALSHSVSEEAGRALAELDALEVELRALEARMAEEASVDPDIAARYDRVATAFSLRGGFEREARIAEVLAGLGFDDEARGRPLSSFSGGWLMRVELAKLLLARPEVLLLDEPTNHLDLPAIEWFEQTLTEMRGAVVIVSHDRTFLRKHVSRVAELDGRGRFTVYEGSYDHYLRERQQRRETLMAQKARQDRQVAETRKFIDRFRYKASKARQVQSRIKALDKLDRIEIEPEAGGRMKLRIPAPPRAGETVMRLSGIHKSYGDNPVYEGMDFRVQRSDRVALVGPNGAGKTTLLRIVAGALPFERGERTPGHNVRTGFFAQHQLDALDGARTVLEELGSISRTDEHARLRHHLGAFLFSGDDVDKKVSVLSGGEKARLALAKLLLRPANLLVLDEPTNHLDIEAREVLEDALRQFQGTLVFVSHDRSLINAIATRVVEVKAGVLREYIGNYDDYQRKAALEKAPPPGAPARGSQATPAAPTTPPAARSKLSKAERQQMRERRKSRDRLGRQIATLEERILAAEQDCEALGCRLGDPEVWSDAERLRALQSEREELQRTIEGHYREWERLNDELEVLEALLA